MSEDAKGKTKAAPAKKTQHAPKRQEAPKLLGLRPWEPGSAMESPRADPRGDPRVDGGRPLDPRTRIDMESRFGHDFGRVRIHTGPDAAERASTLGANAYTLGLNVYFGAGRYRPDHPAGQKLIVHELEHVVRAGPAGPAIPMLDPDPAADHEEKLRKVLTGKNAASNLKKYVEAHAESFEIAERLLVTDKVVGPKTTVALLRVLFKKDPASEERVAGLMRASTKDLRVKAADETTAMLKNYEDAAFAYAVVQWTTKRRDEEKAKRPKPPKPARGEKPPPPELTAEEKQFEAWRVEAQKRFDELAAERKTLLPASSSALDKMVKAAEPVPYAQGDILEMLAEQAHGAVDEARRIRIRTFEDVSLLTHEKSASVTKKLAAGEKAIADALAAETKAREKRETLEADLPPEPPAPEPAPAPPQGETRDEARKRKAEEAKKKAADKAAAAKRKAAEKTLAAARTAEEKATGRRETAEKAITLEGVKDSELKYFLESQDPTIRKEAEDRLAEARVVRQAKLDGKLPTATQEAGLDLATLLDDKELWWIYHTALNNVGSGFGSFSHEHTLLGLVTQRSAVSTNRQALGVDSSLSVGTYHGHGEGQYDINTAASVQIKAVQPDKVDLTRAVGRMPGSTAPRIYEHVSTQVRSFTEIKPEDADEDVLAKLAYGFFGRSWKDRKKMSEYLAASAEARKKLTRPAPDSSRLIAGLVFDKTIAGTTLSSGVSTARTDIRAKLETALHAELRKLTPAVDIPDKVKILADVDASAEKQYGGISMITKDAYDLFWAVPAAAKGKTPPYPKGHREKVSQAVFSIVNRIALEDAAVNAPLEKLLADLLTKSKGNRGGPHVTLIHHYKEPGTGKEAWIEVDYYHLLDVSVSAVGASLTAEDVIGKVGSSGNAISPHIHMAIRVYEKDPRKSTKESPARVIGYLVPLEFFPIERPGAKKAATPPPPPPPPAP